VRVFLDTSVILSACGSPRSLSRLVVELAPERRWILVSAAYCRAEALKNLGKFPAGARGAWGKIEKHTEWVPNALTARKPLPALASKDKPVLVSALAAGCAELLTLDTGDFGNLLGKPIYGLRASTPRDFLVPAGLGPE
jgi:hypothetical protein